MNLRLGSSTYLTDNFGRPSHYYETLPFGEMMVEHNQSANNGTNNGYNNAYKFNDFGVKSGLSFKMNEPSKALS